MTKNVSNEPKKPKLSSADRKLLFYSARKISKQARKYAIRQKVIKSISDPLNNEEINVIEPSENNKNGYYFIPLNVSDSLKFVRLPPKKSPKRLPIIKMPQPSTSKASTPIILRKKNKPKVTADLQPESIPKAIIHRDVNAVPSSSSNIASSSSTNSKTYHKEFETYLPQFQKHVYINEKLKTKSSLKKSPFSLIQKEVQKTIDAAKSSNNLSQSSQNSESIEANDSEDEQFVAISDDESISENNAPIKYTIPQNLLASESDKVIHSSCSYGNEESSEDEEDCEFEGLPDGPKNNRPAVQGVSNVPTRSDINVMLIDNLAYYRVIARYLLDKKNLPLIDFDSTVSEYINVYKSLNSKSK